MVRTLFTNAKVIDPEQGSDAAGDIWVEDGLITDARDGPAKRVIDCAGKCLAPGLVDWGVHIAEPDLTDAQSAYVTGQAAAKGGVTTIIARPELQEVVDRPEQLRTWPEAAVRFYQMGALSHTMAGGRLAELGLMQEAGALAFTDGERAAANTVMRKHALDYAASLGALVVLHPQERDLSAGMHMTSGKFATLRGLAHVPGMAERMGVEHAMALTELTGARVHLDQVTTAAALPALQRARVAGCDVTAGISIHHLTLNALDIGAYRTAFKFVPPLRSEDDRMAMIAAVRDGEIDVIFSGHTPRRATDKALPFEQAPAGSAALETLLPAALRLYHEGLLSLPELWRALSLNPARRLGLPVGRISAGAPADLVLFDPDRPFIMKDETLMGPSRNSSFHGARMEGKVLATYLAGQVVYEAG